MHFGSGGEGVDSFAGKVPKCFFDIKAKQAGAELSQAQPKLRSRLNNFIYVVMFR